MTKLSDTNTLLEKLPPENRAAVVSTYLFIAYFGTIVPIIFAGWLSDHFGLKMGVFGFCIGVGLLCLGLLLKHLNVQKNTA